MQSQSLRNMNVVILDDDPVSAITLKLILDRTFKTVDIYNSGAEFFKAQIKPENSVDILFLDINMPNINGITILDMLHFIKSKICIVSVSGTTKNLTNAIIHGAHSYIRKPYIEESVNQAILYALATHEYKSHSDL